MNPTPSLTILGGGPAGYPAAFLAADLGLDVTLVDSSPSLGGTCLHRGCIPSKTLLHAVHELSAARAHGAPEPPREALLESLRARKAQVVDTMAAGLDRLASARHIRRIRARAGFAAPDRLRLLDTPPEVPPDLPFSHLLVAVGSEPVLPPGFPTGHPDLWTSTEALDLPEIPDRLLVIGGGAIGLELGLLYAALGSRVTLTEMLPSLFPSIDRDLMVPLLKHLRATFTSLRTGTAVADLVPLPEGGLRATLAPAPGRPPAEGLPFTETFDKILVAAGRRPALAALHPERANLALDARGFPSPTPAIRFAGDCASAPLLAHKATHEARLLAARMAAELGVSGASGTAADLDAPSPAIPAVIYTDPELAVCGLGEAQAKAAGIPVASAKCHWAGSGRAQAMGRPDGLAKWVYDPDTLRILGAGIVGTGAGELLGEALLALECKATLRDVARTIHPHPTLTETWMEAASAPLHPIHALPRRR